MFTVPDFARGWRGFLPYGTPRERMRMIALDAVATPTGDGFAFYREHGYHIEPGVFTPATCDALIDAAARLPGGGGEGRPAMHPHLHDPLFLEAMRHPALLSFMVRACGGPVSGLQSEFFFCRPGTPGFTEHQDNFFVEAPDGCFASAWLALTDVGPENGGLMLYPGSHRLGRLPVTDVENTPRPDQDPNARRTRTVLPPGLPAIDAVVPKGGVVFLHGLVVHSSHTNRSDGHRYALLNTYIRTGAPFRPGQYARRTAIPLD